MKLQDKHREYAVKCYAAFMQPSDMLDAFMLKFQDEIPELQQLKVIQDTEEYNYQDEQNKKNIKEKLRNQLRRYDIRHQELPEKYRELFNQTRQEYILKYIGQEIKDANSIVQELEALYGYVKQCIYGLTPSDRTIKNLQIAQNLLDRIAEYKVKE